jgi:hypothetical protein
VPVLLNPATYNKNLVKTIKRIDYLRHREEIELLSTAYARSTATNLIISAASSRPNYFTQPWISGDELGGVRAVWWRIKAHAQVRLIVPPTPCKKIAIYCEIKEESNLDFDVTGKTLSQYLEWICQIVIKNDPQKLGSSYSQYPCSFDHAKLPVLQQQYGTAHCSNWDN